MPLFCTDAVYAFSSPSFFAVLLRVYVIAIFAGA
jgi:hypothetical protein